MQSRTWRTWASRTLVPRLERPSTWARELEWGATNQVLAATPSGWLAQGVAYSRTRSKESYNAYAWVAPLFIPFDSVVLSWSHQLSQHLRGRGFTTPSGTTDEQAAQELANAFNRDGRVHLERVGTLDGFGRRAARHQREVLEETGAFWHAEQVGYTQLLLGQDVEAAKQLERQRELEPGEDRDWVTDSRLRCGLVLDLLLQDPARAVEQLAVWAAQTAAALDLTWRRPN